MVQTKTTKRKKSRKTVDPLFEKLQDLRTRVAEAYEAQTHTVNIILLTTLPALFPGLPSLLHFTPLLTNKIPSNLDPL
jgi:hypothetical protein